MDPALPVDDRVDRVSLRAQVDDDLLDQGADDALLEPRVALSKVALMQVSSPEVARPFLTQPGSGPVSSQVPGPTQTTPGKTQAVAR
jgi:hypothetical protein